MALGKIIENIRIFLPCLNISLGEEITSNWLNLPRGHFECDF